jgi:magnesium-transporting ATPase (P-type)
MLKVNPETGLKLDDKEDYDKRDEQFGSNYKPPPKTTHFCRFFLAAMDDFMLKILLVCAFLSIAIDMSLADADHRNMGKLSH